MTCPKRLLLAHDAVGVEMSDHDSHPEIKKMRSLGMLHIVQLRTYGVTPDTLNGAFANATVPLRTVERHPELHVISAVRIEDSAVYLNRYEPGARVYYIGNGCADPWLEVRPPKVPPEVAAALFRREIERQQANGTMSSKEHVAQSKFFDNIAYGRPPYEGVLTREEVIERRNAAAAAVRKNRTMKKSLS